MKLYSPDKLLVFPWFIQPKLNGVYAELGIDGLFRSKTGKYFPAVQKTWQADTHSIDETLCGEFYVHGWSLQKIISAVTPDEPNELSSKIKFVAYDIKLTNTDCPQFNRLRILAENEYLQTFEQVPRLDICLGYQINSLAEGTSYYKQFLAQGYEGAVYRPYYYGELLKRKPFKDAEFECIAVHEGLGKRKGHVGKFVLRDSNGKTFNCGGGRVSYKRLQELFRNPPIGKMITVRYQHTSDDGIPLCAQFIAVRDYE